MFNRSYINMHRGHPHYFTDGKISALQRNATLSIENEELLLIIRNLSDPTKLKIYFLLQKVEEISVNDLARILALSQSTVSHALSDLRNLGLVEAHRCGKLICYSLKRAKQNNMFLRFLHNLISQIQLQRKEEI